MKEPDQLLPLSEKHAVTASPGVIEGASDGVNPVASAVHGHTTSPGVTIADAKLPSRAQTAVIPSSAPSPTPVDNTKRPPPFSRKVTKGLFIKPASQRPPAPTTAQSVRHLITHSWLNILLVCNPISWALHYTHQTPGAVFAVALAGIVPLAGILGYGTEAIAMYTGDALGGLINASLGNATEFIIAILLLVKCEIRVVQASLLGGLLSNLLLVLGMAFIVAGLRRSELEFQQTAAQLNTSLMTLAVIALIIPSAFAFALEATVGEETERERILQMSRGSSIILIFIYISYMVFQLYSHAHYYNPDADMSSAPESQSPSPTRQGTTSTNFAPSAPVHRSPEFPPVAPSAYAHGSMHPHKPKPPRRASSLPFGSAKALGSNYQRNQPFQHQQYGGASQMAPFRYRGSQTELRQRGRSGNSDVPLTHTNGQDFAQPSRSHDVEGRGSGHDQDSDSDSDEEEEEPEMNLMVALIALIAATGLTYLTAEALTDSLEEIGQSGTVSPEWLGLILLAVVGNAAEHVTAVFVAYRNKVDLALAVSVGSCIQIALFVIPLLVLIGWIADKPMSLLFDPLETITLFLSVLLVRFATEDGRTHYMSGVALLGTYILIAFSFWYYPTGGVLGNNLYSC